jgi:splicing factor 3B subunit 3
MHLYGLTIQRSAAINCAVYGNFSKPKVDEVIVSHGKTLELYRVDNTGKIHSVVCTDVFGLIRDIKPFRLTGPFRRAGRPRPSLRLHCAECIALCGLLAWCWP